MARREIIIEQRPQRGMIDPTAMRVHRVQVDDQAAIGPWIMTLAARFGYPFVDSFGTPIQYQLRAVSGNHLLLTTGQFADARFPSGSHFVLEPERPHTTSRWKHAREKSRIHQKSQTVLPCSRRSLLSLLAISSCFGLGSGITTAFTQHLMTPSPEPVTLLSLQTLFAHHQQPVRTLTWSPDGRIIASGSTDGSAFVWNREGGTIRSRYQFSAPIEAMAWSPDGTHLLIGSSNTVSFFNAATGVLLAENATQHTAPLTSLGWTQESVPRALSAGTDNQAVVWSGQSYQPLVIFRHHTSAIEALAIAQTTVVTVSEGGLARMWSALNGQELHGYYSVNQQALRSAALSSTGSLAIGGDDHVISLWMDGRICQHQELDTFGAHCLDEAIHLQGHTQSVRSLAFSPDGRLLASGGEDHTLIIWSQQRRTPLFIQRQKEVPRALSWSPTGHFLGGALGSQVAIWHVPISER
ncbi:WD40 repeat domain-containing protein [Tengunoibacter tsumagoiensis]|uniref:Uncharacterized protein n=1 Tax=Tengunoibacter tsumagoiensis TaxID=2014871 RepID=A0A402A7B6_9CHLR|nr:WD40 repeat domain-containing protein [Tengunoibacter tsumagoiensis]GCE15023.1 hypothetical protein KTT_48820 [Tengunoibacter tsumagoiensis]